MPGVHKLTDQYVRTGSDFYYQRIHYENESVMISSAWSTCIWEQTVSSSFFACSRDINFICMRNWWWRKINDYCNSITTRNFKRLLLFSPLIMVTDIRFVHNATMLRFLCMEHATRPSKSYLKAWSKRTRGKSCPLNTLTRVDKVNVKYSTFLMLLFCC